MKKQLCPTRSTPFHEANRITFTKANTNTTQNHNNDRIRENDHGRGRRKPINNFFMLCVITMKLTYDVFPCKALFNKGDSLST